VKLGDFPLVETLVDCRARLVHKKDHGRISIDIDRDHMPPDFVAAVEHAIKLELRNRIVNMDEQLLKLGVIID
jgi:hypothetical protein